MFATEAEFVRWPTDFGLSVTSRLLNFLVKSLRAWRRDQSGYGHSSSQDAHFSNHCQCVDAKTVTATFVSTSAIPEFSWIQGGVDLQFQESHVAADTPSRNLGISTVAPVPNHD